MSDSITSADVIICGGGPAGISAGIASARTGADTVVIEETSCLGGVWTSGLLSYVLDSGNKSHLIEEYQRSLEDMNGKQISDDVDPEAPIADLPWVRGSYIHDPEIVKLMLDRKAKAEGIRVRLYTRVTSVEVTGSSVDCVVTDSKSGTERWRAAVYVDATGDGDMAALAGCGFDVGHPETGELQPMSLLGLIGGVRFTDIAAAVGLQRNSGGMPPEENLLRLIKEGGYTPSYSRPALHRIRDDLFCLMANHLYGYSGVDADDLTQATMKGREELFAAVAALRSLGGAWRGIHIVATAGHVGVREARRIHGLYRVTADDLIAGKRFDDGICPVTFPVDAHALTGSGDRAYSDAGVVSKPYDVPLRSLIAKDRNNIMMAGRCISGDFFAHASYRVTGNAVILGQAAGLAAAVCARKNISPKDLSFEDYMKESKRIFR